MTTEQTWDAGRYDSRFGYVSQHGTALVDVLDPQPGERILDLGCGTGELMAAIEAAGAVVIGIDGDPAMVATASDRLPDREVFCADGHDFALSERVDAVFSNAALHWMTRPDDVLARVHTALRPDGRFVAEMGGQHNVSAIIDALRRALEEHGLGEGFTTPWYFPSVAEQAGRLESAGFRIARMEHFSRPTALHSESDGVADWITMFGGAMMQAVPTGLLPRVLSRANDLAAPVLLRDGAWFADYWRLRFVAVRLPG